MSLKSQAPTTPREVSSGINLKWVDKQTTIFIHSKSANEYCLERWSALIGERLPDLVDLLQMLNSVLPLQPADPEEWISTVREVMFGRHEIDWSLFQLSDHNDLFAHEFLESFESDGQIYVRVNEHVTRASVIITDSQNSAELYQFLKEQPAYKATVAALTAYLGLSRGQLSEVASAPDTKSVFKIQKNVIQLENTVLFLSLCD